MITRPKCRNTSSAKSTMTSGTPLLRRKYCAKTSVCKRTFHSKTPHHAFLPPQAASDAVTTTPGTKTTHPMSLSNPKSLIWVDRETHQVIQVYDGYFTNYFLFGLRLIKIIKPKLTVISFVKVYMSLINIITVFLSGFSRANCLI